MIYMTSSSPLSTAGPEPSEVSQQQLYNDLRAVVPANAGIQIEKTGFPRIEYGAGFSSPE